VEVRASSAHRAKAPHGGAFVAADRMRPVAVLIAARRRSFSECAATSVVGVERDRVRARAGGPDPARAVARAARMRSNSRSSTDCNTRCVVVSDARSPKSRSWPSYAARSLKQSPPSASITATSLSTRPGSCAERRSLVGATASDRAPRQPRPLGQLDQQRRARTRHQALAVRRDFYRSQTSRRVHQLGVLLGQASRRQQSRFSGTSPAPAITSLSADEVRGGHRINLAGPEVLAFIADVLERR
jgi:hypothetical protein